MLFLPSIKHFFFLLHKISHETQTFTKELQRDDRGVDGQDLVHPDLLIGHPVDDAVISRVHVPQVVGDGDDSEGQGDHQPQHNVEDDGVLKVVVVGQVVRTARVTLETFNKCQSKNIHQFEQGFLNNSGN